MTLVKHQIEIGRWIQQLTWSDMHISIGREAYQNAWLDELYNIGFGSLYQLLGPASDFYLMSHLRVHDAKTVG